MAYEQSAGNPTGQGGTGGPGRAGKSRTPRGGDRGVTKEAAAAAEQLRAQRSYDDLLSDDVTGPIKDHWKTIQQWRIDEGKNFARSRGSQISRMAAGGMKAGTDQWEANLADIDAAHDREMASYNDSATMGILNQWVEQVRAAEPGAGKTQFSQSGQTRGEYDARTTDDFMAANFGLTDASGGQATAAAEGQRQRGARSQVQQASPWWA